jgi:hypothetical protein
MSPSIYTIPNFYLESKRVEKHSSELGSLPASCTTALTNKLLLHTDRILTLLIIAL